MPLSPRPAQTVSAFGWGIAVIGAALVCGYLLVLLRLYVDQRNLMYPGSEQGAGPEEVGLSGIHDLDIVTADGIALRAWWRPPAQAGKPVILYLHGNAGTLAARAGKIQPYLDAGLGVLLLAWRGYEGRPGQPSEAGLGDDARAAIEFLHRQGVSDRETVLYGESLGSGVAVTLAAERTVRAVVLETPYDSIASVAAGLYPWAPVRLLIKDRFDAAAVVDRVDAPLLILSAGRDEVVPSVHAERLYEAATEPKRHLNFPNANHADLYDHGAPEAVLAFLDELGPYPAANLQPLLDGARP